MKASRKYIEQRDANTQLFKAVYQVTFRKYCAHFPTFG